MLFKIGPVQPAARLRVLRRSADYNTGAAQAIEALRSTGSLPAEHSARGLAEGRILTERAEHPAQRVAEDALFGLRLVLQRADIQSLHRHRVQSPAHQIRIAADEAEI